jgi:hypothetical protein
MEAQRAMKPIVTRDDNRLKFEQNVYDMSPPPVRRGIFSGLMRGLGTLSASVGFAAAPFFPPAAILGASGIAVNSISTHLGNRSMEKRYLQSLPPQPLQANYPGVNYMSAPGSSMNAPVAGAVDVEVMDILTSRQATMLEAASQPWGE